ncbi:MAG: SPOR domain-containing protein [Spirochaetaceae bacterium]|jgi:hypothetical protein|nr:SPOR domain-containing protein [Spirochaetaceae bacterium]
MKKGILFILLATVITSFVVAQQSTWEGNGTWYQTTARNLYAKHANLPFGTRLRVTNLDNNKSVIVTVNGRIPDSPNQLIDVAQPAAENIGMNQTGTTHVKIEVLTRGAETTTAQAPAATPPASQTPAAATPAAATPAAASPAPTPAPSTPQQPQQPQPQPQQQPQQQQPQPSTTVSPSHPTTAQSAYPSPQSQSPAPQSSSPQSPQSSPQSTTAMSPSNAYPSPSSQAPVPQQSPQSTAPVTIADTGGGQTPSSSSTEVQTQLFPSGGGGGGGGYGYGGYPNPLSAFMGMSTSNNNNNNIVVPGGGGGGGSPVTVAPTISSQPSAQPSQPTTQPGSSYPQPYYQQPYYQQPAAPVYPPYPAYPPPSSPQLAYPPQYPQQAYPQQPYYQQNPYQSPYQQGGYGQGMSGYGAYGMGQAPMYAGNAPVAVPVNPAMNPGQYYIITQPVSPGMASMAANNNNRYPASQQPQMHQSAPVLPVDAAPSSSTNGPLNNSINININVGTDKKASPSTSVDVNGEPLSVQNGTARTSINYNDRGMYLAPEPQAQPRRPASSSYSTGSIKIMPSLPDPSSNRNYRVQVGAYSSMDSVRSAIQRIYDAGYQAYYESTGSLYRVVLTKVPAWQVSQIAQALDKAGFSEIWVRQE